MKRLLCVLPLAVALLFNVGCGGPPAAPPKEMKKDDHDHDHDKDGGHAHDEKGEDVKKEGEKTDGEKKDTPKVDDAPPVKDPVEKIEN